VRLRGPQPDEARMPLVEHLRELRRRVIISAIAVAVATAVAFGFHGWLLHLVTRPYCGLPSHYRAIRGRCTLVVSGVLDPFMVTLRLSMYAGLLLASPVWLWQLWRFISPGLHAKERRWAVTFVSSSVALFCGGAVVAYVTLPEGLRFLLHFATGGLSSLLFFDRYLSFFLAMVFVFAISFEFPLFLILLNLAGIVSYQRLRSSWRAMVFGIFVFAALITPSQDPYTMSALAGPMCLLYLVALLVTRVHDRRAAERADDAPFAHLRDDELSPLTEEPARP
jgi:sec-independent protein translocase protein TatC